MKLKNRHLYSILIALGLCCTACKKWLDVKPKTEVSEDVLFQDEQGFKDALTGVYTQMGSRSMYGKELTMGLMDVLSQNYNVSLNTNAYYQAGRYNYADAGIKTKIDGFWNNSYKAIANLNNVLGQIDQKKDVFTGINYRLIKGEALGLRAFLHFDLLRAFGPIPVDNMDTKAIPYIKSFNMDVTPKITFKEVADQCLADLNEASALLAVDKNLYYGIEDIFRSFTRNHMNYWAATSLMARIYLYREDRQAAYGKAREVIDAKVFPFVASSEISSASFPNRTFSGEHIFGLYVANLPDINAELFKLAAANSVLTNTATFINNRFEINNGGSTDYRFLFLWKTDGPASTKYPVKYWSDDISYSSNASTFKRVPLIRLSEIYYIAAEASTDLNEKIDLLNEVRVHRGLSALAKTLSSENVETEIFKEYKKEFYQEGQLFFYYKRKNKTQIEGYGTPVGNTQYVFPLPDDEIEFNRQ
ncbi:hypothetical protein ABIE26_004234 [Pedobacter africanus]|uniref:Uncharacterized protein n=1 Tax=Pedobacter africanus TaxID=151894 RepID=A0ACC6L201_9SPHI|nr:RagB/SusD family nutrient uptake outer membrane protein [Pedobacter africanus]MDR6785524.1 hypothetical protein [Pedobacter africanus]